MKFEAMLPWALTPQKAFPDIRTARENRDFLRNGFVHARAERQPEFCPPWVQGQSIGWRVCSPIDVDLSPLPQYEVATEGNGADAARATGQTQVWVRGDASLALTPPPWLNAFEYLFGDERQNMFIPNGLNTIEWRLGWNVTDHEGFGLLIVPSTESADLGVEVGYLSTKILERTSGKGVSLAIRPRSATHISRGQEIARLVPINAEALAQ